MNKIKKDDTVVVISGKYKGLKSKVIEVMTDKKRVRLENVQVVRHLKANVRKKFQSGGRSEVPGSVHISKVMLWSDAAGKGIRPKIKELEGGKKARYCPKSDQLLEK